jgi:phosphoserine phosphatase
MYANELEIIDGKLTGNYLGELCDGKRKPNIYKPLQTRKAFTSIKPFVGDGANDLPMLNLAG